MPVACFVVVAGCRCLFLIHGHDALGIGFYLVVFGLCCAELYLIVAWVHRGDELSATHEIAFLHVDLPDGPAHAE